MHFRAPVLDTELSSWGASLAAVSEAVLEEMKLPKGVKRRSCEAIIQAVSQLPNLGRSTVNTHVRKEKAGLEPAVAGRPLLIAKEDQLRVCAALARASGDLEPFSCAETQGTL